MMPQHETTANARPFRPARTLSVRRLVATVGRATTGVVTVLEVVRHIVRPGPAAGE